MTEKQLDTDDVLLAKVGETRRSFIRTIAAGTAFVLPLVASFSTNGLRFNTAEAGVGGGNMTGGGDDDDHEHKKKHDHDEHDHDEHDHDHKGSKEEGGGKKGKD